MASSDAEEQESILTNLEKTRRLWSSKADIGTLDYLIPKSPVGHSPCNKKPNGSLSNGRELHATDIVKSNEHITEDYELPDIKSIKSQWEKPNSKSSTFIPSPSTKSPAMSARERSVKRHSLTTENQEPVTHDEQSKEEPYEVELHKLTAHFESAAKAARSTQLKSNANSPVSKAAIKEHVSRRSSFKSTSARNTNKKLRFEEEVTSTKETPTTEQRIETENMSVDLTNIKSQFENRKDEHLVTPALITNRKTVVTHGVQATTLHTTATDSSSSHEVVRPNETQNVTESYEVELGALKKRFEQNQPSPVSPRKSKPPVSRPQQSPQPSNDRSSHDDSNDSPRVEIVRSSERVYDQMTGEESVKERLQRFNSITKSNQEKQTVVIRRLSQKKTSPPVVAKQKPESVVNIQNDNEETKGTEVEIVRSPPAGTKETPDYTPSINLRQTKALFEVSSTQSSTYSPSKKKPASTFHTSTDSTTQSPTRIGRSSVSRRYSSRSSSHHSSASSPSPSGRSKSSGISESVGSNLQHESDDSMSETIKPPPAGTKETPDYVPAVKVSSMKSMFEQPKSKTSPTSAAPPRRQLRNVEWANGNEEVEAKSNSEKKVVAEGTFEDRGGIVRPPTAGTKERPSYNLSSDFLKSRAAMFESPGPKSYEPRNTIKTEVRPDTEIVRADTQSTDVDYQLSTSLQDTKKRFENGTPVQADSDDEAPNHSEVVLTEHGEVVRPPPAGTRDDSDVVPASNLQSARDVFESKQEYEEEEEESAPPKEQIDITEEVREVQTREEEINKAKEVDETPIATYEAEEEQKEDEESDKEDGEEPTEIKEDYSNDVQEPNDMSTGADDSEEDEQPLEDYPQQTNDIQKTRDDIEEVISAEPEPTTEEEVATREDSDSETEGEYVLENNVQEPANEEAAGIVPVRVAVPDQDCGDQTQEANNEQVGVEDRDSESDQQEEDEDKTLEKFDQENDIVQVNVIKEPKQTLDEPAHNGNADFAVEADGNSNYLD